MTSSIGDILRGLPSVSQFIESEPGRSLGIAFGEGTVKLALRRLLDEIRSQIRAGQAGRPIDADAIARELEKRLTRITQPIGRKAINATGILLHTGLGRAPLCQDAIDAMSVCSGYSVLQASLESGDRSLREENIQAMLVELLACEAATVVNNNAAATMLILNTLAAGKEVIISRGQLIEIGGSFRMTEVMAQSSAILREVGTTNRTHLRDYESAIGENTGVIIHVHTSNYRIRGFAGTPDMRELCNLGRKHGIPVIDDLGSGAIVPLHDYGLSDEPLVKDSLAAGADVVCFSGDKLICGPQSGIICGKAPIIAKIRKNPYARMFRVCKLTLAGLEATLLHFINRTYTSAIPFYSMLSRPVEHIQAEAEKLVRLIADVPGIAAAVDHDLAYVGSGSIPDEGLPSRVVRVSHPGSAPEELTRRLRMGTPSVFARIAGGKVVLDLRTLFPGEVEITAEGIRAALST